MIGGQLPWVVGIAAAYAVLAIAALVISRRLKGNRHDPADTVDSTLRPVVHR